MTSSSKSLAHNVESFGVTIQREENCNFLAEKIRLLTTAAKGRRYSIEMLIYAFNVFHKSTACYEEVQKVLCLYCNTCDTEWHLLLIKASGRFVNVLLNDYSIDKTNQNIGAKVVRKLS